jgi:tetratricopeptide (TPR) repeat protein
VTTREVLGLHGEEILRCEPLTDEDAEALFVMRAKAARNAFAPSDDERRVIARLVTLLDRLPLAIELAAARVRVLTPQQVLERMGERFKLLSSGGARRDRQATLRVTLDWSWDLLSPCEKSALAQVSVFEGGFTLESAEDVLDLSAWPEAPWKVDVVHALVDKSLVRPTAHGRFDLLVSVQVYAAEKLRTAGAVPDGGSGSPVLRATLHRHGRHYARSGSDEALEALRRHGGAEKLGALVMELDNLVAACRRAVERHDGATALATYRAAWEVLLLRGPFATGIALGRLVDTVPELTASERALALVTRGDAARVSGRLEEAPSDADYTAALATHFRLGDRRREVVALDLRGMLYYERGLRGEARASFETGLAIAREIGDRGREGLVLGHVAFLHLDEGRFEEALAQFQVAVAIHREVGDRKSEGVSLGNVAAALQWQGRLDDARTQLEAALAILREVGSRRPQSYSLFNLALLCQQQGRMREARAHIEASLAITREVGDRRYEGLCLACLGELHVDEGSLSEADEVIARSEALFRDAGDHRNLAKALCARVLLDQRRGEGERALSTLAEAERLGAEAGAGPGSGLGRQLARIRQHLGADPG